MADSIVCPHCHRTLRSKTSLEGDVKIRCLLCKKSFLFRGSETVVLDVREILGGLRGGSVLSAPDDLELDEGSHERKTSDLAPAEKPDRKVEEPSRERPRTARHPDPPPASAAPPAMSTPPGARSKKGKSRRPAASPPAAEWNKQFRDDEDPLPAPKGEAPSPSPVLLIGLALAFLAFAAVVYVVTAPAR